jgi:hypothetical protein
VQGFQSEPALNKVRGFELLKALILALLWGRSAGLLSAAGLYFV